MNRPLCLHPLALTHWERILLHGGGVLGFRPGSAPAPEPTGRSPREKVGVDYGRTRDVARRYAAGEFPGKSFPEVAALEGVDSESLRAATWRVRNEPKGRAVA